MFRFRFLTYTNFALVEKWYEDMAKTLEIMAKNRYFTIYLLKSFRNYNQKKLDFANFCIYDFLSVKCIFLIIEIILAVFNTLLIIFCFYRLL